MGYGSIGLFQARFLKLLLPRLVGLYMLAYSFYFDQPTCVFGRYVRRSGFDQRRRFGVMPIIFVGGGVISVGDSRF